MAAEKTKPWLDGIVDTLVAARLLRDSTIPHRNRLAVILLDSAFETTCRAYLRNEARIQLDNAHRHRKNLIKTMRSNLPDIDGEVLKSIDLCNEEIRCAFFNDYDLQYLIYNVIMA